MNLFWKCLTPSIGSFLRQSLHDFNNNAFLPMYSKKTSVTRYPKLNSIHINFNSFHRSPVNMCSNHDNTSDQVPKDLEDISCDRLDLSSLTPDECIIHFRHQNACKADQNTYTDPATGYNVFTRVFHIKKGKCCGNACRHCPYNHMAVPEEHRTKKFNSSFYV